MPLIDYRSFGRSGNLLGRFGNLPGGAAAAATFDLSFLVGAVDNSTNNPTTYASLTFGAANANRTIIVGIHVRSTPVGVVSVTIGGVSATPVSGSAAAAGTTTSSDIWQAAVPTGTSGDVVVTYGAAPTRSEITLYRLLTVTPTATSAANNSSGAAASLATTITVPASGKGISVLGCRQSTVTSIGWTNATQDVFEQITVASLGSASTAVGSGSTLITGTPNTSDELCMSSAAWGP